MSQNYEKVALTYLIFGGSHGVALLMFQRLIFKIKFNIGAAIGCFHHSEKDLHSAFWNRFLVLGLAEFYLVAPDITHLINKEHLVNVDFAPLVHYVLDYFLALKLTHG